MRITFVDGVTVIHLDKPERKSNTGHVGICRRRDKTYQVCMGSKVLGWCKTLDDAVALRAEADKRTADGNFDAWYADIVAARNERRRG